MQLSDLALSQVTHPAGGGAQIQSPGFQPLARRHQRACTDKHVIFKHRAVQYGGTHADQAEISDGAGVQNHAMADGDIFADYQRNAIWHFRIGAGDVQDAAILNIGARANTDIVHIATDHRAGPDRHVVAERDATDYHCAGVNISACAKLWLDLAEWADVHECLVIDSAGLGQR